MRKVSHRVVFSFPEVRWQFTKPNEVPLNMKETPTAPLFPVRTRKRRLKRDHIKRNPNCPLSLQTAVSILPSQNRQTRMSTHTFTRSLPWGWERFRMRTYKVQSVSYERKLKPGRRGDPEKDPRAHSCSPRVLAMPVFTLEVLTWLMRFSCSGLTSTATLMFHSDCMAIYGKNGGDACPSQGLWLHSEAYHLHCKQEQHLFPWHE